MATRKTRAGPASGGKGKTSVEPALKPTAKPAVMPTGKSSAKPVAKPAAKSMPQPPPKPPAKPAAKGVAKPRVVAPKAAGDLRPKAKGAPRAGAGRAAAAAAEARYRMICEAAYFIAQRRAFIGGDPAADWLAAERQIDALLTGQVASRDPTPPED